jgi:hypothetical protein
LPVRQLAEDCHENQSNRRDDPERKTDEQFVRVLRNLRLPASMLIIHTMVLAFAMCVKRLFALVHFGMPPAMAQIVNKRPNTPARSDWPKTHDTPVRFN